MTIAQPINAWYACVPSVVYQWAGGTLQEAVSRGYLSDWPIEQYYELFVQIVTGVSTLHERHLLHGDIRPANILYFGEPSAPLSYKEGDYGSFSHSRSVTGDNDEETGNTCSALEFAGAGSRLSTRQNEGPVLKGSRQTSRSFSTRVPSGKNTS
jgi:serine/threonine protein kinase